MNFVFRSGGGEQFWTLDRTTLVELAALMFRGQMRGGRQVVLPTAEIRVESAGEDTPVPLLRLAASPVEICMALSDNSIRALKAGVEKSAGDS